MQQKATMSKECGNIESNISRRVERNWGSTRAITSDPNGPTAKKMPPDNVLAMENPSKMSKNR